MAYKKKSAAEIKRARKRLSGVESISNLNIGSSLTSATYMAEIEKTELSLSKYNNLLSQADGALTELKQSEKNLADFSERILSGIGSNYGFDSVEYEKAGGTRKSEKKKPVKKKAA